MKRTVIALALPFVSATAIVTAGIAQSVNTLVDKGKNVFEANCSNQYCHGPAGRGAQGPKLADFPMTPEHVRTTVREGRTGTPMVAFKDVLPPGDVDAVIAYVLSISSGGVLPTEATLARSGTGEAAARPTPSTAPVAIGAEKGTPAEGATLFFDATNMASCRTCHSFNKRGGVLGMDFAQVRKTPQEILASLSKPRQASRAYPVVNVTLASGEKLTGIRGPETADTFRLFTVAIPPVRRSFLKTEVTAVEPASQGIYDHTKLKYSRQQLLDIAALLGTPAGAVARGP